MSEVNDLVISTDKLTKAYNGRPVLRSLDLKVPKNSIFGFPGPNGAGKTTAIRIIIFALAAIYRFDGLEL